MFVRRFTSIIVLKRGMHLTKKLKMASLGETVQDSCTSVGMDQIGSTLNNFDFFQSIRTNSFAEFTKILVIDNSLLEAVSTDGFNGLQMAAKYGHVDMVETLLDKKAETVSFDVKYGRTFLHWASVNGHSDVVFLAIRDFPEILKNVIDLLDNKGHTSLMLAAKGGRKGIVSLLLAAGADVSVKIKVNNVDKTVFDLCSNASDMLSLLTNARITSPSSKSAAQDEATPALAGNSNSDIQWGLSSGASISQMAHNRTKCIALGWIKRSVVSFDSSLDINSPILGSPAAIRTSSEAFGADCESCTSSRAVIQDVVVKLNLNPRELREEFAFREQLNSGVSLSSNGRDDSVNYFVSAVCPNIITATEKSQLWYGILLEKGVIDLHHLYVAMTQHSTHSRLNDLRWKLKNIHRITRICGELQKRDLVWYDLKPSNFIVFPADELNTKIKQHKWIQQSSWDSSTYRLKATDLSSIYTAGASIPISSISCTAKFLSPTVAKLLTTNSQCTTITATDTSITSAGSVASSVSSADLSQSDSGMLLTTCPTHMLWSLGMCSLQLLSSDYSTLFVHLNLHHASEVYAFLNQNEEVIQLAIDDYIAQLVEKLLVHETSSKLTLVQDEEAAFGLIREGLHSFLWGLLRVDDSKRCSITESLVTLEKLLQLL